MLTLLALALVLGVLAAGCGGGDGNGGANGTTTETTSTDTTDTDDGGGTVANGSDVFIDGDCGTCHTLEASGFDGTVGPNLDQSDVTVEEAEQQVRNGGGAMPSFEGQFSDDEIRAVAEYVVENRTG
jgi:mono/diheme cytochrome c family protein